MITRIEHELDAYSQWRRVVLKRIDDYQEWLRQQNAANDDVDQRLEQLVGRAAVRHVARDVVEAQRIVLVKRPHAVAGQLPEGALGADKKLLEVVAGGVLAQRAQSVPIRHQ